MDDSKIGTLVSRSLPPFVQLEKIWWEHEHQDSQWREHQDITGEITCDEITTGAKSDGYRLFGKPMLQQLCKILAHSKIFSTSFGYRQWRFLCK